jgi:hypothetical protein
MKEGKNSKRIKDDRVWFCWFLSGDNHKKKEEEKRIKIETNAHNHQLLLDARVSHIRGGCIMSMCVTIIIGRRRRGGSMRTQWFHARKTA